jgi:hypothetical protein
MAGHGNLHRSFYIHTRTVNSSAELGARGDGAANLGTPLEGTARHSSLKWEQLNQSKSSERAKNAR